MEQQAAEAGKAGAHSSRTLWLALIVGLLLIGVAGVIRTAHERRHSEAEVVPLRGGAEETPAALEDALARTAEKDRLPLLLKYAQDPSPGLRYAAVDALGSQRGPAAAEAVERAFQDSSSVVR